MKFEDPTQETLYQMIKKRLLEELKNELKPPQPTSHLTDKRKLENWDKFP